TTAVARFSLMIFRNLSLATGSESSDCWILLIMTSNMSMIAIMGANAGTTAPKISVAPSGFQLGSEKGNIMIKRKASPCSMSLSKPIDWIKDNNV
ncbi:MAG: hypothetical protein ACI9FB_003100, partial [Candidatus Azotimanducaceae bacterium]